MEGMWESEQPALLNLGEAEWPEEMPQPTGSPFSEGFWGEEKKSPGTENASDVTILAI